jgi:hypothetical protein
MAPNPLQDNDSWKGGSGEADSKVMVTFHPDLPPELCRRSRLNCKGKWLRHRIRLSSYALFAGGYACQHVPLSFCNADRHELDPEGRLARFEAHQRTRGDSGMTKEQRVAE